MVDIQEKVEQFLIKQCSSRELAGEFYVNSEAKDEIHALIRAVVEKCWEKAGEPLSLPQGLAIQNRIEQHFAWLEK